MCKIKAISTQLNFSFRPFLLLHNFNWNGCEKGEGIKFEQMETLAPLLASSHGEAYPLLYSVPSLELCNERTVLVNYSCDDGSLMQHQIAF